MITRLVPVLIIIGAIALFFGYAQPTYSDSITTLRGEIRDLDTALKAARNFKDKEVELTNARSRIAPEQLERLEAFLPDSVDNVQLIVDLNSLAARSGITLSEFDIVTGQEKSANNVPAPLDTAPALALGNNEPIESLELSVSATGTYASFRGFLEGVEQSLRPLDVVELSVEDSATGVYNYDMTFRLYWLR